MSKMNEWDLTVSEGWNEWMRNWTTSEW